MRFRRAALDGSAVAASLVVATAVSAAVLRAAGYDPRPALSSMWSYGTQAASVVSVVNRWGPYYLSAVAVALPFRMRLFNIGVEGQYRIAALVAALFGASVRLPPPLHVASVVFVAMVAGAAWAAVPGVLRATRGVHEVISTIMMNTIATGVGAYLLARTADPADLVPKTPALPRSAGMPTLDAPLRAAGVALPPGAQVRGFVVVAALAGLAVWLLVERSRFGYELRAMGASPGAARAGGVDAGRVTVATMMLSGGLAGLVGMGDVLGFFHRYSIDLPTGLDFTGIAVALVGRGHPGGMAAAAALFAFLDRSAQILDLRGIPREIVVITQGVILLSVVIGYEVARRAVRTREARAAAAALAGEAAAAL